MLNHVTPEERDCPHCGESILVSFDVRSHAGLLSQGYNIETVLSKPAENGATGEDQ